MGMRAREHYWLTRKKNKNKFVISCLNKGTEGGGDSVVIGF